MKFFPGTPLPQELAERPLEGLMARPVGVRSSRENIVSELVAFGEEDVAKKVESADPERLWYVQYNAGDYLSRYKCQIGKSLVYAAIELFEGQEREPKNKRRKAVKA